MEKPLDIKNMEEARAAIPGLKTAGDPGQWKVICKASSALHGWMKSTKAMDVPGGALVQVSTQQGENVAEALAFVPGVMVEPDGDVHRLVGV